MNLNLPTDSTPIASVVVEVLTCHFHISSPSALSFAAAKSRDPAFAAFHSPSELPTSTVEPSEFITTSFMVSSSLVPF